MQPDGTITIEDLQKKLALLEPLKKLTFTPEQIQQLIQQGAVATAVDILEKQPSLLRMLDLIDQAHKFTLEQLRCFKERGALVSLEDLQQKIKEILGSDAKEDADTLKTAQQLQTIIENLFQLWQKHKLTNATLIQTLEKKECQTATWGEGILKKLDDLIDVLANILLQTSLHHDAQSDGSALKLGAPLGRQMSNSLNPGSVADASSFQPEEEPREDGLQVEGGKSKPIQTLHSSLM